MKNHDHGIINKIFREIKSTNQGIRYADISSLLEGTLEKPEYPETVSGYKCYDLSEVGLDSNGICFGTIEDYRKFGDKLESLQEEFPNLRNIEMSDSEWDITFNYDRAPDEWEIKDYEEKLESYAIVRQHEDYIKERYSELEQQDRERHNARVLEEIEKLKKKLK